MRWIKYSQNHKVLSKPFHITDEKVSVAFISAEMIEPALFDLFHEDPLILIDFPPRSV